LFANFSFWMVKGLRRSGYVPLAKADGIETSPTLRTLRQSRKKTSRACLRNSVYPPANLELPPFFEEKIRFVHLTSAHSCGIIYIEGDKMETNAGRADLRDLHDSYFEFRPSAQTFPQHQELFFGKMQIRGLTSEHGGIIMCIEAETTANVWRLTRLPQQPDDMVLYQGCPATGRVRAGSRWGVPNRTKRRAKWLRVETMQWVAML